MFRSLPVSSSISAHGSLEPPLILPPVDSSGNGGAPAMPCLKYRTEHRSIPPIRDYAKMGTALATDKPDEFKRGSLALPVVSNDLSSTPLRRQSCVLSILIRPED